MAETVVKNLAYNGDKKINKLQQVFKQLFNKNEGEFTAERAWLESTYGTGVNLTLDERIAIKQRDIMDTIKSKFRGIAVEGTIRMSYASYHCLVDINEDLAKHTEAIFKPFIDSGFEVINLSNNIKEIEEENIYLISWRKAFNK